jgi:uncharacterized membrane protein SirB2
MNYFALKHLHVTLAALSGLLFLIRGFWMLSGSARLQQRWVNIAPHVVDTLLLASAIGLAVWSSQYPGQSAWLTGKVGGLLAYIGLGVVALKRGRTPQIRAAAFAAALVCFAYIVAVAITKNPLVVG